LSIGNRSSYDDSKSDGPEDETTVVEPDQGNGEDIFLLMNTEGGADVGMSSLVTYYQPAAAWCRSEPCCAANIHSGA
jgi:hypothetical protein